MSLLIEGNRQMHYSSFDVCTIKIKAFRKQLLTCETIPVLFMSPKALVESAGSRLKLYIYRIHMAFNIPLVFWYKIVVCLIQSRALVLPFRVEIARKHENRVHNIKANTAHEQTPQRLLPLISTETTATTSEIRPSQAECYIFHFLSKIL